MAEALKLYLWKIFSKGQNLVYLSLIPFDFFSFLFLISFSFLSLLFCLCILSIIDVTLLKLIYRNNSSQPPPFILNPFHTQFSIYLSRTFIGKRQTEHFLEVQNARKNHNAISCDTFNQWVHITYNKITKYWYKKLQKDKSSWYCRLCIAKVIPFSNTTDMQLNRLIKERYLISQKLISEQEQILFSDKTSSRLFNA